MGILDKHVNWFPIQGASKSRDIFKVPYLLIQELLFREAAKKVLFLVARPLRPLGLVP